MKEYKETLLLPGRIFWIFFSSILPRKGWVGKSRRHCGAEETFP